MEENYREVTESILFPDSQTLNQSPEQQFSEKLKNEILYKITYDYCKIYPELKNDLNERMICDEIAEFIREHIKVVGREQAIKDFQCGLNYLNKDAATLIKEDGIYGDKTFASFLELLQYYPPEIVKEAIRKGAINNLNVEPTYNADGISAETIQQNLKQENI